MILYKYRNNSEYTDKLLIEKKVWLSNAEGLNDPFECTIGEIAHDWIENKIQQLKIAHMSGFIIPAIDSVKRKQLFYDLNHKQTKEFLNRLKKKDFDAQYKTVRDFIYRKTGKQLSNPDDTFANFDKQLNEVGIFSLSETDDNELLWAHYSDSSKGISLGFEVSQGNKLANEKFCVKVNYSDERPTFTGNELSLEISFYAVGNNVQKIAFTDSTFRKAISTKKTIWSYEKEWRYLEEKSGSYPYPGNLKEIIFGLKCPEEKRKHYFQIIKDHFDTQIDFYEMFIMPNSGKLSKRKVGNLA